MPTWLLSGDCISWLRSLYGREEGERNSGTKSVTFLEAALTLWLSLTSHWPGLSQLLNQGCGRGGISQLRRSVRVHCFTSALLACRGGWGSMCWWSSQWAKAVTGSHTTPPASLYVALLHFPSVFPSSPSFPLLSCFPPSSLSLWLSMVCGPSSASPGSVLEL